MRLNTIDSLSIGNRLSPKPIEINTEMRWMVHTMMYERSRVFAGLMFIKRMPDNSIVVRREHRKHPHDLRWRSFSISETLVLIYAKIIIARSFPKWRGRACVWHVRAQQRQSYASNELKNRQPHRKDIFPNGSGSYTETHPNFPFEFYNVSLRVPESWIGINCSNTRFDRMLMTTKTFRSHILFAHLIFASCSADAVRHA